MPDHTHAGTDCFDPDCTLTILDECLERLKNDPGCTWAKYSNEYEMLRRALRVVEVPRLVKAERLLREARASLQRLLDWSPEEMNDPPKEARRLIVRIDEVLQG